jgi:hypothetical protein
MELAAWGVPLAGLPPFLQIDRKILTSPREGVV